jgi:autotransporter-associated beta strand protein
VTQAGTGTLILTAANTYSGGTTISAGTLQLDNIAGAGTGTISLAGGNLRTTVTGSLANTVQWLSGSNSALSAATGTTLSLTGALGASVSTGQTTNMRFGTVGDTGTIVANNSLGSIGTSGTATLNDISLIVQGGTLREGSANAFNVLGFFTAFVGKTEIDAGATLDFNGEAFSTVNNLQGAGTLTNSGDTTVNAGNFAGTISGTGGLVKATAGTLILTGTNTYSGTTTINAGTLQIGNGGTGGTLGSGNVVDNASLVFNRSDAFTVANVITGGGSITKVGAGTLNLTGSNSAGNNFTGTFNLTGGGLAINGVFGDTAANAATLITAGGTVLSGSGTFRGSAAVNGAINPGNSPGTLTIAGNLALGAGTILNYELGEPGTVGGANNDLLVVGGNLTLDGTLNTIAFGPGYGPGYYRLINYGGTLTDNGLSIGSIAGGLNATVLTNITGQVNLLLGATGIQTVQYWDGTDMTGASAAVGGNGGSGTWNSTNTNWTSPTGYAVNSNWAGQVGVFAGAAGGTVTIVGVQPFQELRFQTAGYTLNGATAADGLATTGGFSVIDVSTGIDAFINAQISGSGGLTKTGTGRLYLGGTNTFAGLTTVSAGTLGIQPAGSLAGAVVNNATLDNFGTIAGLVTNTGTLFNNGVLNGGLVNSGGVYLNNQLNGTLTNLTGGSITLAAVTGIGAVTQQAGAAMSLTNGSVTFGSLAGAGTIDLGAYTLTTNGDNTSTTFSGVISGNGRLTKVGTGTLTLAGANTYTGQTTVSVGTLTLSSTGSINSPGALVTTGISGTLNNAGTITAAAVFNSGTLISTGVINAAVANGGTTNLAGQLNGNLSNAGLVTLTGATSGIAALSQTAAGTFNLNGFSTTIGSLAGAGFVQLGSGTLTTNGDNSSTTFSGVISGSGGLTKAGTGTLTLSGVNTYTGTTNVSAGTLALTSTGSLAGPVSNAATFTNAGTVTGLVTNSVTLTSTGVLNGGLTNSGTANLSGQLNGALTNTAGTVTLTGTTTGITAVTQSAGATFNLAGFNTTIGSLAGDGSVQLGSATLSTNGNNASTTFAGVISGTGNLTKAGTGSLTLTGANTYTGTTTISAGTLALGNGGTSGSLAGGPIVDNGILVINRSDAVTLANVISGTGSVRQNGSGTTTLTGANTYSGGTTVSAGRLVGNTTSLQGNIVDNATLEFAQATAGTFAGTISGTGALEKTGAGRLILTGNNANLLGATRVLGGELAVNSSLAGSVVTVGSGATLSGTGPIGGLIVQSGGTASPGNGVGTLTVNGNVAFQGGSTYLAEITPAAADRIQATGTAQLGGTLAITNLGGNYTIGSSYVLLQADGGRTGTFANATGLTSFGNQFRARIVYTGTQVQLLMGSNLLAPLVGTAALTANEGNFVTAYDAAVLAGLNTQPFDAFYNLSGGALASAVDQLTGGIYPTVIRSTLEDERLVREAALRRMQSTQDSGFTGTGAWAEAFGSWGTADGDGNAAAFDRDSKGFAIGVDGGGTFIGGGEWRAGVFGHYVESNIDVDAPASHADVKRAGAGALFAMTFGQLRARLGASFSEVDADVQRSVAFTGFSDTAIGHPDGQTLQGFAELGYRVPLGAAAFVEPFANVSMTRFDVDAVGETGGASRLRVAGQDPSLGTASFGVRGETALGLGAGSLRVGGRIAGRHTFGDTRIVTFQALDLAPLQPFAVSAAQVDDWALEAGLDLSFDLGGAITASIGYSGILGDSATDHAAHAGVSVRF